MSRPQVRDLTDLPPPICDTCGGEITDRDQPCPARDSGVCAP